MQLRNPYRNRCRRKAPTKVRKQSLNFDDLSKIFPTAPGLDDLGRVGMSLGAYDRDSCGSLEFCDYYPNIQHCPGECGELTPVSHGSEMEFSSQDATAGCSAAPDFDFTLTEELDNTRTITSAMVDNCNTLRSNLGGYVAPILPSNVNVLVYSNDLAGRKVSNIKRAQSMYGRKTEDDTIHIRDLVKDFSKEASRSNVNMANVSCKKWTTNKERFFETCKEAKSDNIDLGRNLNTGAIKKIDKDRTDLIANLSPGSILVREGYIDPPKVSKLTNSQLECPGGFRRASDVQVRSKNLNDSPDSWTGARSGHNEANLRARPQFLTQMSQPCGESRNSSLSGMPRKTSLTTELTTKNARFTTIKVNEDEHAASLGNWSKRGAAANLRNMEPEMLSKRKNTDNASDCE